MNVGERIARFRKYVGLNQAGFGARCGQTNKHISEIERGTKQPSLPVLIAIINAFGIDARYLFGQIGDDPAAADMSTRKEPTMTEMERLASAVERLETRVVPPAARDEMSHRVAIDAELREIVSLVAYRDAETKRRIADKISGWLELADELAHREREPEMRKIAGFRNYPSYVNAVPGQSVKTPRSPKIVPFRRSRACSGK